MKLYFMVDSMSYSSSPTKKQFKYNFCDDINVTITSDMIGIPFKTLIDKIYDEVYGVKLDSYSLAFHPKGYICEYNKFVPDDLDDEHGLYIVEYESRYRKKTHDFIILNHTNIPDDGNTYTLHTYIEENIEYPSLTKDFCTKPSETITSGPSGMCYFIKGELVEKAYERLELPIITEADEWMYGEDATGCFQYLSVVKWYQDNEGIRFINDSEEGGVVPIARLFKSRIDERWTGLFQIWNDKNMGEV